MFFTSHSVTQKLSPTYRQLYIGGGAIEIPSPPLFLSLPLA